MIEICRDVERLIVYLRTWSAVQHYIKRNGINPVDLVSEKLKQARASEQEVLVSFPIYTRIGTI